MYLDEYRVTTPNAGFVAWIAAPIKCLKCISVRGKYFSGVIGTCPLITDMAIHKYFIFSLAIFFLK